MEIVTIEARDIPDAWFQCIAGILEKGFRHEIQHGSNVGQTRLEFDWVTVAISHPYSEPYDSMLPEIPSSLGIPNPVAAGYVEQYLPYLMTGRIGPKEAYTYGQRMTDYWLGYKEGPVNQVERFILLLRDTPETNQAILQVAQPTDCFLDDPPCLRHIDMRAKDGRLIFYPCFRSWDLWAGFPANLAGIAVLQKYMADCIGIEAGEIVACSKGMHIYGYCEELARIRRYGEA